MDNLLVEIRKCNFCEEHLPLGARPIIAAHQKSKIIIIGQAPGLFVHQTGVPWDDKSGENLRNWMGVNNSIFYDCEKIALVPMGFCYPGKGKSGDNPPSKECAPKWHSKLIESIENPNLILLIGKYAQDYYLLDSSKDLLTKTVRNYKEYLPRYFVLPHPSPRNNIWQAKNQWFKDEVLIELKKQVSKALR